MRAIDADALMPKLKFIREAEHQIYGKESWKFASKCITVVEDAPTIEERKTGKWKYGMCSECGFSWADITLLHEVPYFCPNCGSYNGGIS